MHEPADAVAVVVLDDEQPRVAAGHAQAQRRLDVLGGVDRDDRGNRRHHLARLLLVQVEDPGEHARLALVDLTPGLGLRDQQLELVGGAAATLEVHVDAEQPQDAVGDRGERDDERPEHDTEGLQWPRHPAGDRLGAVDGIELGHHLAGHELHGCDERERHDRGDRHGDAVAERFAERRLEDRRERGLTERSHADRGERHADLHRRDVLVDVADLRERERRALGAFLAHHFQARPARAHERVLGDHEECVYGDQQRRDDELHAVHARAHRRRRGAHRPHGGRGISDARARSPPRTYPARPRCTRPERAPLLRGSSSSSFIRRSTRER